MGGRTLPTKCPHGAITDWGDFGSDDDADDDPPEFCEACEADRRAASGELALTEGACPFPWRAGQEEIYAGYATTTLIFDAEDHLMGLMTSPWLADMTVRLWNARARAEGWPLAAARAE